MVLYHFIQTFEWEALNGSKSMGVFHLGWITGLSMPSIALNLHFLRVEPVLCFNFSPLSFKGWSPASVRAGLLTGPLAQTWAATLCMTHVAPKNVHFNSALARRKDQRRALWKLGGSYKMDEADKGLLSGSMKCDLLSLNSSESMQMYSNIIPDLDPFHWCMLLLGTTYWSAAILYTHWEQACAAQSTQCLKVHFRVEGKKAKYQKIISCFYEAGWGFWIWSL